MPDKHAAVSPAHSMNSLKRQDQRDLPGLLNEIPTEKFEQILDILQELKDKTG